jgi:hypothetical protein
MEVNMSSVLKNLKFVETPARSRDPVAGARTQLIARLEEQKMLFADPTHTRKWQRYTGRGENRKLVNVEQRVKSWVRPSPTGTAFCLYVGASPLEISKGKGAIAVESRDEIPALIDALVDAAKNGEMDDAIKATLASRKPRVPKPKAISAAKVKRAA